MSAPHPHPRWLQDALEQALQQARLAHGRGETSARDASLAGAIVGASPHTGTSARDAALAEAATLARVLAVALLAPPDSRLSWGDPVQEADASAVQAAPATLLLALAAALLAGDRPALRALSMPGVFAAAQASASGLGHLPCWSLLGDALVNAILGGPAMPDAQQACERAIAETAGTALDPDAPAALLQPLARLLDALARRDAEASRAILLDAFERHRAFYADPQRAGLTLGHAAWELSACALLAHQRLGVDLAPMRSFASLCESVAPGTPVTLCLTLPTRTLPDARQAGWQADLDGVPRRTRQTRSVTDDVEIIATGSFGIDQWRASFHLDAASPGLPPNALLAASDVLAAQIPDGASEDAEEHAWQGQILTEALAALDAALATADASSLDRERLRRRRAVHVEMLMQYAALPALDARQHALAMADVVKAQVQPVLEALAHDRSGSAVQALRPRPGDAALAFTAEHAETFAAASDRMWAAGPRLPAAQPGSRIVCHVAPAGMLAEDNELSRHFPGGYRALSGHLQPGRVWVAWKVLPPGASEGMAYDGLVWLDDHWAWFPKPFRWLG